MISTLAPYVLPLLLPELHRSHPHLCLDLLETQTKSLLSELAQGTLDVLLLALPIEKAEFETIVLFNDRFLLAVPADDPCRNAPRSARATSRHAGWCCWKKATVCAIRRSSIAVSATTAHALGWGRPVWPPSCRWWQAAMA